MSEQLDGILSERLLDQLASDLGIDPDDMRKHPFFRVIKGTVLLTYPLRAAFEPYYKHSTAVASGAGVKPPEGTLIYHAVLSGAATTAIMKFYFLTPKGYAVDAFSLEPKTAMQGPMYCDGDCEFMNVTGTARDITLWGRSFK